ncbi:MAG: methyltransferase type 11 [Proteobacteria bacterium]|nr:MAG: methyltransferase type 11 [Pseudomonadota bacterium]
MLNRLFAQFSGPRGPLGEIAGLVMAHKNRALNAWIVSVLDAGPEDRVVEIGYGPGLAVEANAARALRGCVAGVDRSEVMWRHARRRNAAAIAAGRADLRVGDATALPFGDAAFTRALAVNSLQFWRPPEAGLRELRRVLAPGGRLILAQRLHKPDAGRFDRSRFGMTDERLAALLALLRGAGFAPAEPVRRAIGGETLAAIVATR